jgi:hypothetical protein
MHITFFHIQLIMLALVVGYCLGREMGQRYPSSRRAAPPSMGEQR